MTRSELLERLFEDYPDLPETTLRRVLDLFFESIVEALEQGNRVELRGFGVFTPKLLKAKSGRNPQTGEQVDVPEKYRVRFTAGKRMNAILNEQAN